MSTILGILAPSLIPALSDGLRGLWGKLFGGKGAEPQNFQEALSWENLQVEKLKALAMLDMPGGEIYKWAATWRAINRYALGDLIILGAFIAVFSPGVDENLKLTLLEMAGQVFAFFFGDRMYFHVKQSAKSK